MACLCTSSLSSSGAGAPAPLGLACRFHAAYNERLLAPLPALRPLLPSAERILPYLRRLDETRTYTNWGPLACELEHRLAAQFGVAQGAVVTASSGTSALAGAILATAGRASTDRPIAVLPAFTFVATALAVELCGYRPYIVDVSPSSWMMEPAALMDHPALQRAGLVVPVAPFGRPVALDKWLEFQLATRIPVVIDGAGSFESLASATGAFVGAVPVTLSFHATKTFSTGEGGCVVTTDPALAARVGQALNFGFFDDRECRIASMNGKMSEYHAAVGLAELDGWPGKARAFGAVADAYRCAFETEGLADRLVCSPSVAGCYVLVRCGSEPESSRVQACLADADIGFRLWYGGGLLAHRQFGDVPHDDCTVTLGLGGSTLGLPVATDLHPRDIARVAAAIRRGVHAESPGS